MSLIIVIANHIEKSVIGMTSYYLQKENSHFIVIENTVGNRASGYQAVEPALNQAKAGIEK